MTQTPKIFFKTAGFDTHILQSLLLSSSCLEKIVSGELQDHWSSGFIYSVLLDTWFVSRSYGPVNPIGSCQAQPVHLTSLLLGRLIPLCGYLVLCIFFCKKLTTAILESAEEREWQYKIFRDQVSDSAGSNWQLPDHIQLPMEAC